MSYGQVAAAAGNPRGARQVSGVHHSMSRKYELPWHRIINAQGGISTPEGAKEKGLTQRELLEAEGIIFKENGKIEFATYRWFPDDIEEDY